MQKINWTKIIKIGKTEYFAKYKNLTAEIHNHKTCYSITISENKIVCDRKGFTSANSCKNYFRKFLIKNTNFNN